VSLKPGITGQPAELLDGAKVNSLTEYTTGNGVQLQGRTSGVAIEAGKVGEVRSAGPTTTTITITNGSTYYDIVTLTLTAGTWLVNSNGFCANGAATIYSFIYRWKIKGVFDSTEAASAIYGTGGSGGQRACSPCMPRVIYIAPGDSNKTVAVQVAMDETNNPSRQWVQYIEAIRIA
jgi:hypothetical protein